MKKNEESLNNFLERARRGRPAEDLTPPPWLASSILHRWRQSAPAEGYQSLWLRWSRWGALSALAMGLLIVSLQRPAAPSPALAEFAGLLEDPNDPE
jgi:hypothetical protein